jgi:Protein of unknown function (DUF3182)
MERAVVVYPCGTDQGVSHHERLLISSVAAMIADLQGWSFAGEYEAGVRFAARPYFVPYRTLIGLELASRLGIEGPEDLFGGVVPYEFLGTKAISHGLVRPDAHRPPGWSEAFSEAVRGAVLPGYTVFSLADARLAGDRLLGDGAVRVKETVGAGGGGQRVARTAAELECVLDGLDPAVVARVGLVLERNLDDVATFSVGEVRVGDLGACYHGVQRETVNNRGQPWYGGSDLVVYRGGLEQLPDHDLPADVRLAVSQAITYDRATKHYPGLIASRRNYDAGRGVDSRGVPLSGVFEQSWRTGGASGPEIAALRAFRDDPALQTVTASAFVTFGEDSAAPAGAIVHFAGVDPDFGPLRIYTVLTGRGEEPGRARRPDAPGRSAPSPRARGPARRGHRRRGRRRGSPAAGSAGPAPGPAARTAPAGRSRLRRRAE